MEYYKNKYDWVSVTEMELTTGTREVSSSEVEPPQCSIDESIL